MWSLRDKGPRDAFYLGLITGLVYFLGTLYWVVNSITVYGKVPIAIGSIILLLLCLYLALYIGVFSLFFSILIKRSKLPALFFAPVIWVTLEYARSYALTGFPWSSLGYSQYRFLELIQIADITGVYGISFLVVAFNGAIFDISFYKKRRREMPLFPSSPTIIGSILLALIIAITLFYGMWQLNRDEGGRRIRVSVVQGNIDQAKKWDIKFQRQVIDAFERLTGEVAKDSPELIVWPETSVPFIFGLDMEHSEEIVKFEKGLNTYLLFGSTMVKDIKDGKYLMTNSAILLDPDGKVDSFYDKIHLVPYGEYVPLKKIFPFIDKLVTSIGDFIPGNRYTVFELPDARFGTVICYEIIFPGLVRKFVDRGADFIVTITNDAWFGRTSAPYQHFSMAVFRAVENRVPVVRAANTGISGFIDDKGRIIWRSGIFKEAAMTKSIAIGHKKSFYTRYGDLFSFACIIVFIAIISNNLFRSGKGR